MDLGDRKTYVGGSDAAAILGLSPWKSRLQLWAEKTGITKDTKESDAMEWGTRLESVIFDKFKEQHRELQVFGGWKFAHPEYPYIVGHVDGTIFDNLTHEDAVLEIKTANAYSGDEWQASVPTYYLCQIQHYLAVTGWEKAYCAVLIGGSDYREFEILRDDEFIDKLIEEEVKFWQEVQEGTPPTAADVADSEILSLLTPVVEGKSVDLPDDADWLIGMRTGIKAAISDNEEQLKVINLKLQEMLGDAEIGVTPKHEIRWRKSGKGRTLNIKEREV